MPADGDKEWPEVDPTPMYGYPMDAEPESDSDEAESDTASDTESESADERSDDAERSDGGTDSRRGES